MTADEAEMPSPMEMGEQYVAMGKRRITADAPLFAKGTPVE